MMNHLVGLERPAPSMNEIQAAPLNLAGVCTVCTQAPYLALRVGPADGGIYAATSGTNGD